MKIVPLVLLTCLTLPLCAEAKTKPKPKPKTTKTAEPKPVKNKLIDMNVPAGENPEGLIISTPLSGKEIEFFQTAFELGRLESYLGGQAQKRGEADRVKAVGDALQASQAEENERLVTLARRKGLALPEKIAKSPSQQKAEQQLAKLSGPGFDKAVLEQISTVTQQALDAYESAAESPDPEVRKLATELLPLVREKLTLANRLAGKALPPGAKPGFRENALPPP